MRSSSRPRSAIDWRTSSTRRSYSSRANARSFQATVGEVGFTVPLDQAWLARHMRVSRTPLRQALLKLASERLIDAEPHRSAVVSPLSLVEIEDLYQSRRVLESMLAEVGAARLSDADLRQMRDVVAMQDKAVRAGDPDPFTEL